MDLMIVKIVVSYPGSYLNEHPGSRCSYRLTFVMENNQFLKSASAYKSVIIWGHDSAPRQVEQRPVPLLNLAVP